MTCVECGGPLKITNVYLAGSGCKTQSAECVRCDKRFALVTVLVGEVRKWGSGAYALAQRYKKRGKPTVG